jgi:diacylglycerol O-acyltransferase / wax synthase
MSAPGNHTQSVAMDMPIGPMPTPWRIRAVARKLTELDASGQPLAAGAAMSAMGLLPARLHRWAVRQVYQRRFFNAIVSVLPGQRRPAHIAGARLTEALPVLSLADGVGLAVGAIGWGEHFCFGVTADPALAPHAEVLTDHLRDAFTEMRERR